MCNKRLRGRGCVVTLCATISCTKGSVMEFASIERVMDIDASPEVVYAVVSSPEHVRQWWSDDARFEAVSGAEGEIVFGDPDQDGSLVALTVVDARPPSLFSFRWTHPLAERATAGNSLLVTFSLTPTDTGTRLQMVETGFRDQGWERAKIAAEHAEHGAAWDHFLPRLVELASGLGVSQ